MVPGAVLRLFLAFAAGYFLSALLRAVTATLAPVFSTELNLSAGDLGVLGGAYFLGFALMQLPLGVALDRFGSRRVGASLLLLAVLGCVAFSQAESLGGLVVARALIGMGVAACLMAALTAYRLVLSPSAQLRANAWMLMTGSLGMLSSTLPVQALLPHLGWRGLFLLLAVLLLLAMFLLLWWVPAGPLGSSSPKSVKAQSGAGTPTPVGYAQVFRHPFFLQCMPVACVVHGGMTAMQTLWVGPWLTRVAGWTSQEAAAGLFSLNLGMLLAFSAWGSGLAWLQRSGWSARRLLRWGVGINLPVLVWIVWAGESATAWHWTSWCVLCSVGSLGQPAVAQAFPARLAGRALSAYNLMIFVGVFLTQWGLGLLIDAFMVHGSDATHAFQGAVGVFAALCCLSVIWFWAWDRRTSRHLAAEAGSTGA
jgi:predicted MFS family arabinose efflux permease